VLPVGSVSPTTYTKINCYDRFGSSLSGRYRGRLADFPKVIRTVVALEETGQVSAITAVSGVADETVVVSAWRVDQEP